jgi:MoaA/NifB/PqqE/SkfB family radical SAM enzyme
LSGRVCGSATSNRCARVAEGQVEGGLSFASFSLAVKENEAQMKCKNKWVEFIGNDTIRDLIMIQYKRIFVGSACNNNCLYCQKKTGASDPGLSDIRAQMDRKNALDSVELYGGEPTLRRDFFEILNAARGDGYRRMKIITNARAFANINTAVKTLESGCYFFEIKVHHHEPAVHDHVTQVSGSLHQTMQGIVNLRSVDTRNEEPLSAFIQLRILVSRHNYKDIGNVALHFIPYEIDRITLAFDDSQLEMSQALPYIRDAINACILNRVWINTQRIPLCAMAGLEHHVSEIYHKKPAGNFNKSKHCEKCVYNAVCPGISRAYFDNFGFNKLEPVLESRHAQDIRRLHHEKV